jgi:hypothetical protein
MTRKIPKMAMKIERQKHTIRTIHLHLICNENSFANKKVELQEGKNLIFI